MLSVLNVSKRFGPVQALAEVSFDFQPGSIHAILGENGAGKSTLMAVLGGFVRPDTGSVTLKGTPLPLGRPAEARRLGIAMVHQHFTLVPAFTVAESLALCQVKRLASVHRPIPDARRPLQLAESLGWPLHPHNKVGDLAVGVQQRIEILKALSAGGEVLILDEPTAVLSPDEVEDLFRVLRLLREQGQTILLIAHKLSEVLAIADVISVLRHGRHVATTSRADTNASQLEQWMVGELPTPAHVPRTQAPQASLGPKLRATGVHVLGDRGEPAVRGVSFEVAPGEVFGIGGVDGNGQVELAEALAGIREVTSGSLEVPTSEPAYIPQSRQNDGLALSMSLVDNLLVTGHRHPSLRWGPFLRPAAVRSWASALLRRFDVRSRSPWAPAGSLSGGNQQKVVLARALESTPTVLVAACPSRGLDVRAMAFVHALIRASAEDGAVVTLFSTDRDELDVLADRRVFMSRGEFAAGLGGDA